MDKTLLLRACVHGQDALLGLNGMVLAKLYQGRELLLPIHEYVQSGENRIQVILLPSTLENSGNSLLMQDCQASVSVELQKDRGPDLLVQPSVLFELNASALRGQRLRKSRLLDSIVDLPVSFPRWRYLDVLPSSSGTNDSALIEDFLLSILAQFQAGKVSALLPFFTTRNRELATAYGLDPQVVLGNFTSHLKHLCAHSEILESALDPENWRIQCIRNSPVHAVLGKLHEPLLQWKCSHTGTTFQLPMHVGVLGGEVFVLR
ncbi:MAG: hypothetical protein LW710_01970 [Burkholderiales bacterium]|uniref:hypothetical protein n=1 Tax=Limnobacter sp. TaxID=2003368 RepID=UPI0039BC7FBD|nr:hypothetical protein [Burkholderiales bacterium]